MNARCRKGINIGVAGVLTLSLFLVICTLTPAMGEETDPVASSLDLAVVKDLVLSHSGSSDVVTVVLDRPVIYSYYPLANPTRGVIELPQSDPGSYQEPLLYQGGQVKQIRFIREPRGTSQLTRLEFFLTDGAEFIVRSPPEDTRRLIITFTTPSTKAPKSAPVPGVKSMAPAAVAKVSPVQPMKGGSAGSAVPVTSALKVRGAFLRKVSVTPEGIDLIIEGAAVTPSIFYMKQPNRMVVDLPGVRIAPGIDRVPVSAFGIDRVRLGRHEGSSRVVFEGSTDAVLRAKLVKTDSGLRLLPASGVPAATP